MRSLTEQVAYDVGSLEGRPLPSVLLSCVEVFCITTSVGSAPHMKPLGYPRASNTCVPPAASLAPATGGSHLGHDDKNVPQERVARARVFPGSPNYLNAGAHK